MNSNILPLIAGCALLSATILSSPAAVQIDSQQNIIFDTVSKSFTVGDTTNRGLVIIWGNEGNSGATSGTWTVDGVEQDFQVISASATGGFSTHTAVFYLKDPTVGSGTIELDVADNNEEQRVYSLSNVQGFVGAANSTGTGAGTVSFDFGTLPSDSLALIGGNTNGTLTGDDPFFSATSGSVGSITTEALASSSSDSFGTVVTGASGDLVLEASASDRFAFSGIAVTAIPEPSSVALLGIGALALLLRRGRRA